VKYALIFLVLFLAVLPVRAEKIAIAVLDLDAKGEGLSQGVADALTETVRFEFAKHESLDLVAREKMKELAKEKALQLTGCTEVSCAVQIGKALNVQKVVIGSVAKLGAKYTLFLRAVDVEKEVVGCSEREEGGTEEERLDSFVPGLVSRVCDCLWMGKYKEQEKAVREAIRLKPDDAEAHKNLGKALHMQRKYNEGTKEYREAIRLKPNFAEAHYNLGKALADQGKYDEAIKEYRQAIRFKPDFTEAYAFLGALLVNKGETEEAIKEYREAIRLKPDIAVFHTVLGEALRKKGETVEAIQEYREAIRLEPNYAYAIEQLALTLDEKGRRKEAREFWLRAEKVEKIPERVAYIKKRLAEPE
jgi:Flp pilus assembly protein TadD/TolB-like protein